MAGGVNWTKLEKAEEERYDSKRTVVSLITSVLVELSFFFISAQNVLVLAKPLHTLCLVNIYTELGCTVIKST